ncbi:hypothetical protein NDU88_011336 [Pleurodeles waltl]|uniref:Uncharacterized protein n=1 Tax=Pleurodeles waltl TaxID=8319 RepID=A0AAV7QYW3_PLEWA|nr:hypothetical protein NDU88_011336 [Pleurodeles waltl]
MRRGRAPRASLGPGASRASWAAPLDKRAHLTGRVIQSILLVHLLKRVGSSVNIRLARAPGLACLFKFII